MLLCMNLENLTTFFRIVNFQLLSKHKLYLSFDGTWNVMSLSIFVDVGQIVGSNILFSNN